MKLKLNTYQCIDNIYAFFCQCIDDIYQFLIPFIKKYNVSTDKETDFLVEDKYSFELGGKSKLKRQIQNLENAYVVMDGIEIGNDCIIPLWLFGLLY